MESNKVIGLIFPVGGEAQTFLADRDRPYRDIREAVQGEYDELGATFADADIYVNAAGADSLLPNRAINPDAFMDDSGFLSEKSLMRSVVPFGWQAAFCAARTRAYDPLATLADL